MGICPKIFSFLQKCPKYLDLAALLFVTPKKSSKNIFLFPFLLFTRYNLFKEVWCINEKLQTGHTESDHINTEMTTVQDVFNALATNKEDFHNFETSVRKWLKNMVERLRNLPDIDQMAAILRSGGGGQSIRRPIASSVDEMVNYYETLKRHKTRRKRTNQLLKELME